MAVSVDSDITNAGFYGPNGTDVAVADGGTGAGTAQAAAQNLSVPYVVQRGGIPLIALSSGSVAANGAISAITALPVAYPNAYCWFPANALATTIAAGWYYCTFSTTTAGVAFLDTYTSGVPTIPSSPTAVTDGKGAFTGSTSEDFGYTVTIPANSLGTTGVMRFQFGTAQTSNANAKTLRIRWSGTAGTVFLSGTMASTAFGGISGAIHNSGATNKNLSSILGISNLSASTTGVLGVVDSTASTTLVVSTQRATATDNIVIHPPTVEILA